MNQHHDDVNLEHVLPLTPGGNWEQFSDDDARNYCKRLGNLTIIDSNLNVDADNASFDEKKTVYQQSGIGITRSLADRPDWSTAAIEERQLELSETAVRVWRLAPN